MSACTCGPALAMGADLELGCPVHDENARENARRVEVVASGVVRFDALALTDFRVGAGSHLIVEIDTATGRTTVRVAGAPT